MSRSQIIGQNKQVSEFSLYELRQIHVFVRTRDLCDRTRDLGSLPRTPRTRSDQVRILARAVALYDWGEPGRTMRVAYGALSRISPHPLIRLDYVR